MLFLHTTWCYVRGKVLVEQILDNELDINIFVGFAFWCLFFNLLVYPFHGLLITVLFPNSIASHQDEINTFFKIVFVSIWVGGNCLFFRLQMLALFIFEISKTTSEIQVAVNTSFCDCWSWFCDSIDFCLVLWLVIKTHFDMLLIFAHDTPWVSCICNINLIGIFINEDHIWSATDWIQHHFFICLFFIFLITFIAQNVKQCRFLWWFFTTESSKLVLSLRSFQFYVNIKEWLTKPFFWVCLLQFFIFLKDVLVMFIGIYSDLPSSMTIKNAKNCFVIFIIVLSISYMGIFL